MVRPIAANIGVSFPYGVKYKSGVIHKGVDFSDGREGHTVVSCLDGAVTHAGYGGWGPAYGQHVIIKSTFKGKTKWVLYGHLKTENVSVGQKIKAGQKIGTSGGAAGKRYSGNSTGPHLHVQVGTANRYTAYEDPWAVINYKPTPPKPPAVPWFTLCLWPLPGYDVVYGKAHWDQLEPKIVAEMKRIGTDLYALTEVPGGKVASFTRRLKTIGYKVVVTTDGRTIVGKDVVKVGRTKKVTLAEKGPAKDDKQIVMAELWPDPAGDPIVLVVGHLEYRLGAGYDTARVKQAKEEKRLGLAFAKACGIPADRVVFADDENSFRRVLTETYHPDFKDVFEVAGKVNGQTVTTICGWSGKYTTTGLRNDKVKVHKDRPVIAAAVVTSAAAKKLSDHLPTTVIFAK